MSLITTPLSYLQTKVAGMMSAGETLPRDAIDAELRRICNGKSIRSLKLLSSLVTRGYLTRSKGSPEVYTRTNKPVKGE